MFLCPKKYEKIFVIFNYNVISDNGGIKRNRKKS